MMLDSNLEKILTTKQAGPSVPCLDKKNQRGDQDLDDGSTYPSEAEVRLVVRFTVEEQIVYKGRVERVNQLESEELSRVVSRVAWDITKETDKINKGQDNHKVPEAEDENSKSKNRGNSDANKPADQENGSKSDKSDSGKANLELESEEFVEQIDNSDHVACVKLVDAATNPSTVNEKMFLQKSLEITKLHSIDCLSQIEHCRTATNHIKEMQEPDKEFVQLNDCKNFQAQDKIIQLELSVDVSSSESQSVKEALDDCVNRVDLDTKYCSSLLIFPNLEVIDSKNSHQSKRNNEGENLHSSTQNSPQQIEENTELISTEIEPNKEELRNRTKHESLNYNDMNAENGQSRQISDLTSSTNSVSNEVDICNYSIKNGSEIDHNFSTKRIRRSASAAKEQRVYTSKNNLSITKASENNSFKLNTEQTKTKQTNLSLLADSQQVRHIKIFAKWSDNHFYPGTILKPAKDRKFVIGFFDGAQRCVAESDLIPLSNIQGKQVRVSIAKNYCVNAIVHDQRTLTNDQPMFDVEYQQDGKVRKCVPLKDIFLTGEQGMPLINQQDKNSNASNFADVDLDNIIYEKRSRRLQEMEDYEFTENSSVSKRKRGQYNMRNATHRIRYSQSGSECPNSSSIITKKNNNELDTSNSPDPMKTNMNCPNSNTPSEGSSSTGCSSVPNVLDLSQEFYFENSSPHRTKTSLLL